MGPNHCTNLPTTGLRTRKCLPSQPTPDIWLLSQGIVYIKYKSLILAGKLLCGVLGHNTCMCMAGPGLDYKREKRAQN
jgi:hypothetical protein